MAEDEWWEATFGAGSTDLGDVSHIMPAIVAANTLIDLLGNGAASAKDILAAFSPAMAKDRYLEFMRGLAQEEVWSANEAETEEISKPDTPAWLVRPGIRP